MNIFEKYSVPVSMGVGAAASIASFAITGNGNLSIGGGLIAAALNQLYQYKFIDNTNIGYRDSFSSFFLYDMPIKKLSIEDFCAIKKITIRNLFEMPVETQTKTIEKFNLQGRIDVIGKEVFQKFTESHKKALEFADLFDLSRNKAKYALMDDDEFKKVTLNQIKTAYKEEIEIISKRLENFAEKSSANDSSIDNVQILPITQIRNLSGAQLNQLINQMPSNIFPLLSDAQIKDLNLAELPKQKLQILCTSPKLFSLLTMDQVQSVLPILRDLYLNELFHSPFFSLLSVDQILIMLPKLSVTQINGLSRIQKEALLDNISRFSDENINKLFHSNFSKLIGKHIDRYSEDQKNVFFNKLDVENLGSISNDFLKKFSLLNISKEKVDILVPSFSKEGTRIEQIERCLGFVIQKIYPSSFNAKMDIGDLCLTHLKERNRSRLKVLNDAQINNIKDHLNKENLELVVEILLSHKN